MIHEHPHAVYAHERGILDKGYVRRKMLRKYLGQRRLRLRTADSVVVARRNYYSHVSGQFLEHSRENLILPVNIGYREFFVLIGIDTYAVDDVAGDEEVFGAAVDQPVGESLPLILQEGVAADVHIRDENGFCGLFASERRIHRWNVGSEHGVGVDDVSVIRERSLYHDDFIGDEPFSLGEEFLPHSVAFRVAIRRSRLQLRVHEEDVYGIGRVFENRDSVPL